MLCSEILCSQGWDGPGKQPVGNVGCAARLVYCSGSRPYMTVIIYACNQVIDG